MKRDLSYLAWLFVGFLLFFLGVQKPLFMLYNRGFGGTSMTSSDLMDIYSNGLAIDVATIGYLLVVPLLLIGLHWCFTKWNLRRWLMVYCGIMAVALSLAALADASLYEFWEFKLDRMAFFYLGDPKDAFASVSVGYLLLRFVVWVLLSVFTYYLLAWPMIISGKKTARRLEYKSRRKDLWVAKVLLFVVLCGGLFAMIRGLRIWPNTPGRVFYSKVTYYNHAALNPVFNLFYTLTKKEDDYRQFDAFDEEERARLMEGLFPTSADSTEILLNTQRPNVLVIVLEGFGSCFVEGLGGDVKEVGVNMTRLLPDAICFTNCYCGSFRTDRGIVCSISGYLGQPTTSIMRYAHKIKNLPGLPKTLKQYGYQTQALYGGDISFFNMSEYFITSGHDRLVSQDDFPAADRSTKWGVPDHVAFQWLFEDIQQKHQQQQEPWYTTFLTISSHNPFDVPYHRLSSSDDINDDAVKFNAFAYTDSCYGDFIDRLRETPAWDNLLIVTVADHGFNWRPMNSPDFPRIPFLMMGGAVREPKRIETLMSQTDLPAIVLGQMGIPHEDYTFSRDVLGDTYRTPFAFNTFNNGFNLCDTTGCTVYDNVARRAVSGADPHREAMGKAILQTLYHDMKSR
jgi:phosphoglycerol transferase MdoB-like AlkP superfamily enzyme